MTGSRRLDTRLCVLAAALFCLAGGCSALRPVTTSAAEYSALRKTRVSPTLEGRIVAAARYLARFPDGTFTTEVRAFYTTAEPLYFEEHRGTAEGLHVYLAALPRGPHAEEARLKLASLAEKGPATAGFDRNVMGTNARLATLAGKRAAAREQVTTALRAWLDPEAYMRPLSEAKAELLVPWSLSLPWPRCTWDDELRGGAEMRCAKLFELPYEVSNGEGTEERQATVEVILVEDARGRPRRVTIGGPDLFVRLEETFSGRAVALGDPSGRAAGVSRVTELVRRAFSARVSDDPTCRKRTRAPRVLELACSGMRVVVEAALDSAEDDRIVIGPMASD